MRSSVVFSDVDELEATAQALGWNIEYRQMRPGDFSAEFAALECDGISLVSERFNNHLQIPSEPPEGFIGFFLPCVTEGTAVVCGRVLNAGDILIFPPLSELDIVTHGEIRNETLFLAEAEFQAAVRSLTQSDVLISPRSAAILCGDPKHLAAIQHEMESVHRAGSLDSETASNLLAKTILWMADASSRTSARQLTNGATAAIALQAQTYIEERYRRVIRLADLCAFTGVSARTLQRCFASYFQVSPTDYIKARRLNAARRDLVAADPSSHSITTIAMENGFSHLGRFSVYYREHFGESPSETLKAKNSRS